MLDTVVSNSRSACSSSSESASSSYDRTINWSATNARISTHSGKWHLIGFHALPQSIFVRHELFLGQPKDEVQLLWGHGTDGMRALQRNELSECVQHDVCCTHFLLVIESVG